MIEDAKEPTRGETSSGRTARIRLYPGGPLLVRGDVELIGPDGTVLRPRRRVLALCRCGHSALFPDCDGKHKSVSSFTAERDLRAARNRSENGEDAQDGLARG